MAHLILGVGLAPPEGLGVSDGHREPFCQEPMESLPTGERLRPLCTKSQPGSSVHTPSPAAPKFDSGGQVWSAVGGSPAVSLGIRGRDSPVTLRARPEERQGRVLLPWFLSSPWPLQSYVPPVGILKLQTPAHYSTQRQPFLAFGPICLWALFSASGFFPS